MSAAADSPALLPATDAQLAAFAAATYTAMPAWAQGDVAAFRMDVGAITFVAFRGTRQTSVIDWLRDLDTLPMWGDALGVCHAGFLSGAIAVTPAILRDTAARPLVFVGHSLGGALAVCAAALAAEAKRQVLGLVTFGAPRVGFQRLRDCLAGVPTRQYRNSTDPVPEIPLPYWHAVDLLIDIGAPNLDAIGDHDIALYGADVAAYLARMQERDTRA